MLSSHAVDPQYICTPSFPHSFNRAFAYFGPGTSSPYHFLHLSRSSSSFFGRLKTAFVISLCFFLSHSVNPVPPSGIPSLGRSLQCAILPASSTVIVMIVSKETVLGTSFGVNSCLTCTEVVCASDAMICASTVREARKSSGRP